MHRVRWATVEQEASVGGLEIVEHGVADREIVVTKPGDFVRNMVAEAGKPWEVEHSSAVEGGCTVRASTDGAAPVCRTAA